MESLVYKAKHRSNRILKLNSINISCLNCNKSICATKHPLLTDNDKTAIEHFVLFLQAYVSSWISPQVNSYNTSTYRVCDIDKIISETNTKNKSTTFEVKCILCGI